MKRLLAFTAAMTLAAAAAAQSFPSRPITIVVGFEPGGGTDTTARIVAKALGDQLGQQVIVENRAGAGGTIGVAHVAKETPDGYTIVLANVGALTANPFIMHLTYDPLKDLTPISMACIFANVFVVQPSLGVKTLADYVKLAKAKPKTVTYASSGVGGAGHLAGELLAIVAKVQLVHVPYKGGGPAMRGFLSKEVDSFVATPVSSLKQIEAGKAVAIATTGSKRAELMPDVPTVAEQGYAGYEALNWYGFLGPASLPKPIVERLHGEIAKALANPEVIAAMKKTGVEPQSSRPEEFAAYIKKEYDTWGKVIKQAGIKAQ
ncbi:MAG TPA: tripartite tricarboxylate transporter substrate binding protein [Burkholderiales bacterium]|jgi:tripartite-type tricarboxylate transporter receptor subunit TctC|nr:tripartite tricarboxylate transporter substrate binding protein [Burkholderiales bacterium]